MAWGRLIALATMAGCGHTEPFGSQDFGSDQPLVPTPPIQLTLNQGQDRWAAWLPDGSGILYSSQFAGTHDHDVCLALLPPSGGRQRQLTCSVSPNGATRTEALESAAPASDGRLAFVAASGEIGRLIPDVQQLSLGTVADPAARSSLLSIPYTIPGSRTHFGISQIRWLGPNRLVYLGEAVNIVAPCPGCERDTLRSGLDGVQLELSPGAAPQAIPGTENASGISPGANEDEVYYTLGGDTRVYRRILSTGEVFVVHDFGPDSVARDVDVLGQAMAVVVGGRVHFAVDPSLGPTQWDSGGLVHVVSLTDDSDVPIVNPTSDGLFRRPRLSPTGNEIVAERYPLIISGGGDIPDTTVSRTADLYLMQRP
jgi:hypothetical protein